MYKIYTIKPDRPPGRVQLILRAMRLVTILLITTMMQVSAASVAQRISMKAQNAELKDVFKAIRAQSGYDFVFDLKLMEKAKTVTISLSDASLEEALKRCFANQDFTYAIADKTVIVREKTFIDDIKNYFADIEVIGTVLDENGQPMPGVGVKVKGTNKTTVTGLSGRYYIRTNDSNPILIFSYVGYKTKEVAAKANLDVTMSLDPAKLDEVMVIGYGTTTRRLSTGSQAGISAKDIEKQPVTNVLSTLQGRLPGVTVVQSNGLPGAGITVQIRGANSLTKSNLPLFVIDGVPFLSTPINAATSGGTLPSAEGNTSPMNSINPADIESIDILKDADATAIYGSRGANGVVLITTKKGKAGKTTFGVNVSTGASKVANFVETLSTERYLQIRRQAFINDNITPTAANAPDLTVWDQNLNTNFQKELMGNTARTYDANMNLSGGDARTNFYMSGTFHKENNVFPGKQGYHRGAANFSLNHTSLDQRFSVAFSTIYSADKNNVSATDMAVWAYSLAPNYALYNAAGGLNWSTALNNPLGYLYQTNDNKTSNLLSNLTPKYTLAKGLDIKATFGYSKTDMEQLTIRPLSSMNPTPMYGAPAPTTGTVSSAYNFSTNYIIEPQLTYKRDIWKGNLDFLVGGTWQYRQSRQPYYINASGFASDEFLTNLSAASERSVSTASADYKYTSVFARATYNVQNKYITNFTFRRDGSSRFGPNNRFGNFGSVAGAWVFSEENFLKDKFKWFSFGKIRGSYGLIGSDEIGNYQYFDSYRANTYVFNGSAGLVPSRIANNDYKWESTRKLELGLELGFFEDRLSLTASTYRNRTSNQLLDFGISAQAGFSSYQSNLPATVQNSGWEFSATSTNIRSKDFSWTSSFNITQNRNKLLSFPNIEKSPYYTRYVVGSPLSSFYFYQYDGINPATGLPQFADLNKSGALNSGFLPTGAGDRYYVGTGYPKFFGGLNNSITYKRINLDFTFQFVKQQGRSLIAASFYPPGFMSNAAANITEEYLALSSPEKLVTTGYAGAYTAYSNYSFSDASVIDASFIRLKNVNLSYSLPASWLSKVKAQNLRVFTQAQNLFTITKYKGFDPESQGVATPPLRTIVAGLQLSF